MVTTLAEWLGQRPGCRDRIDRIKAEMDRIVTDRDDDET